MNFDNLIRELEDSLGNLSVRMEMFNHIEVKLSQVATDMDIVVEKKEFSNSLYYLEHHREVKMISELLYYVMKEARKNFKDAFEISQTMLQLGVLPTKRGYYTLRHIMEKLF